MAGSAGSGADYDGGGADFALSEQKQVSLRIKTGIRVMPECQILFKYLHSVQNGLPFMRGIFFAHNLCYDGNSFEEGMCDDEKQTGTAIKRIRGKKIRADQQRDLQHEVV